VHRLHHRPIAVILIGIQLVGCVAWTPAPGSPREVIEAERPDVVLVEDIRTMEVGDVSVSRAVASVGLVLLAGYALLAVIVNLSWDSSRT
jgi:hypothetical protein